MLLYLKQGAMSREKDSIFDGCQFAFIHPGICICPCQPAAGDTGGTDEVARWVEDLAMGRNEDGEREGMALPWRMIVVGTFTLGGE